MKSVKTWNPYKRKRVKSIHRKHMTMGLLSQAGKTLRGDIAYYTGPD
jgi:hypothetical protein